MTDESPKVPPPQSPFVSHDEMVELTGYKNHSAQARWLAENDFHFVLNISGRPMVHRAHLAFRMGVPMAVFEDAFPPPPKKVEPNSQALIDNFARKKQRRGIDMNGLTKALGRSPDGSKNKNKPPP
ncbi:MAG: DUF4224 domain-containing protein [Proteobacteria bacterium]|nr:DUF4224 domain-containing protein [Pseudomonadota bacterium]